MNRIAARIDFFDQHVSRDTIEKYLSPFYTPEEFMKALLLLSREKGELTKDELYARYKDDVQLDKISNNASGEEIAQVRKQVSEKIDNGQLQFYKNNINSWKDQSDKEIRSDDVFDDAGDLNFDVFQYEKENAIYKQMQKEHPDYFMPRLEKDTDYIRAGYSRMNNKGEEVPDKGAAYEESARRKEQREQHMKQELLKEFSPYIALYWRINDLKIQGMTNDAIANEVKQSKLFPDIQEKIKQLTYPDGFPQLTEVYDSDVEISIDPDTGKKSKKYIRKQDSNLDGTSRQNPIVAAWVKHKSNFTELQNSTMQDADQMERYLHLFMKYVDDANTEYTEQVADKNAIYTDENNYNNLKAEYEASLRYLYPWQKYEIPRTYKEIMQELARKKIQLETKEQMTKSDKDAIQALSEEIEQMLDTKESYDISVDLYNELANYKTNTDLSNKNFKVYNPFEFYYSICNNITEHINQLRQDQKHDAQTDDEYEKINNPYNGHIFYLELENIYKAAKRIPLNPIPLTNEPVNVFNRLSRLRNKTKVVQAQIHNTTDFMHYGTYFMNKLLAEVNYILGDV